MKYSWQYIVKVVSAAVVVTYLIGFLLIRDRFQVPVCEQVSVKILDKDDRQYIFENEVLDTLNRKGLLPAGKQYGDIAFHQIENMLTSLDVVSTCECYQNVEGEVQILLTQRVPLLLVSCGDSSYYVATDRGQMCVSSRIKTPVVVVTGNVSKDMATHELYDLAQWVQQDDFWCQRIKQINVENPSQIYLVQNGKNAKIRLGDCSDFSTKLNKLQKWYISAQHINCDQYAMVDVQYREQVIGIKKK